jgi:dihydroorotate dehydrogenase
MIELSNGHRLDWLTSAGALGFHGRGWLHEQILAALGFIKLKYFTHRTRTLSLEPILWPDCNLSWIRPWTWIPGFRRSCIQLIPGGGVRNKIALYNPGIHWWCENIGPMISYYGLDLIVSIHGTGPELVKCTKMLNRFLIKGIEVNTFCPNRGRMEETEVIVESNRMVVEASDHPVLAKLSVAQDYRAITKALKGQVEAIDLNSVPHAKVFGNTPSPLDNIGKQPGGGGVSGRHAQKDNWQAVKEIAEDGAVPVIGPSIVDYEDIERVKKCGASAISFGAIHLPDCFEKYPRLMKPLSIFTNPCKPTRFVKQYEREEAYKRQLISTNMAMWQGRA